MSIHPAKAVKNIEPQINQIDSQQANQYPSVSDRKKSNQMKQRKKSLLKTKQQQKQQQQRVQQVNGEEILQFNKKQLLASFQPNKVDQYTKHSIKQGETRKDRLKNKLSFIINTINQSNQVASVSYCDKESIKDKSSESSSQELSNDWRPSNNNMSNNDKRIHNESDIKNQKKIEHKKNMEESVKRQDEQEFLQQKKIKKKIGYKYLFYSQIKEEKEEAEPTMVKHQVQRKQKIVQLPQSNINNINVYEYEKSKHKKDESPHSRLKNKLGFLINLINDNDEVGSVSYYTDSVRNTEKQLVEQKQNKIENDQQQNIIPNAQEKVIFNQFQRFNSSKVHTENNNNEIQQFVQQKEAKRVIKSQKEIQEGNKAELKKSILAINKSQLMKSKSINYEKKKENSIKQYDSQKIQIQKLSKASNGNHLSDSFQKIDHFLKDKHLAMPTALNRESKTVNNQFSAGRYQQKDASAQKVSNNKIISALNAKSREQKSSQNKGKEQQQNQNNQMPINSKNNASSQDSNFSIKLHQIQLVRLQKQIPIQQAQAKGQSVQIDQPTIKENANFENSLGQETSKEMQKNNYKTLDLHRNKSSYLEEDLSHFKDGKSQKRKTSQHEQVISNKINQNQKAEDFDIDQNNKYLIPKNKIQFRLESKRKLQTQIKQKLSDLRGLTDQQKRIATLFKKRQENLAKRVKEQFFPNNALFPSESSNSTKKQRPFLGQTDALDNIMDQPPRFHTTLSNQKQGSHHKKRSLHGQEPVKYQQLRDRPHFPTLSLSPNIKRSQKMFETFNHKKASNDYTKLNFISKMKRRGLNDNLQSNSERDISGGSEHNNSMRIFHKQTVSKLQFYNINKLHKDYSNQSKLNLNAKQKYERLKQLLEQI